MEGPLSYSVDVPEGEISAQRPIFIASFVSLVVAILAFGAGWLLLDKVADNDLVIQGMQLAVVAAGIGLAVFLARGSYRRRMYIAAGGTAITALLCAAVIGTLLSSARPTIPRLRAALSSFDAPAGWTYTGHEEARGQRNCSQECPSVRRTYRYTPSGDPQQYAVPAVTSLTRHGWHLYPDNVDLAHATIVKKHGVYLLVRTTNSADEVVVIAAGSDTV